MASVWYSNPGIRVEAIHLNSMGNFNKLFAFYISGAQPVENIQGDPNGWKHLDTGEMSDEDYLSMVQIITTAHASQKTIWVLHEHFNGQLTNLLKGIYVF